jgi:predicted MFS family arabinose efflux permease
MIVTDAARCVLHLLVAILIFTNAVEVWQLIITEALFGAAQAFFQPAYTGLLPQTVPEELIQDARALTESTTNVAALMGPALATALVLGVGAGEAFLFDAATFLVSALLLLRVRPRPRGEQVAAAPMWEELRSGWREVRSRTWVWVTIVVFTGAVLCIYAQWYALAPVIARDLYGSAGVFGVLESLAGAGAVCGAVVGLRWRPARPLRAGMLLVLAWPLQNGALALGAPVAVVIVFAFATGFTFSLLMIWWETALAQHIPAAALSRVSAWDWMGSLALMPVGFALAGPLAASLGARTVLGVGSVVGLLLLAAGLLPRATRQLRAAPAPSSSVARSA